MSVVEWTHDLGNGRLVAMERVSAGYQASCAGFRGVGTAQEVAFNDLLARMWDYCTSADDGTQSPARSGHPHGDLLLQHLKSLVDQIIHKQRLEDQQP